MVEAFGYNAFRMLSETQLCQDGAFQNMFYGT